MDQKKILPEIWEVEQKFLRFMGIVNKSKFLSKKFFIVNFVMLLMFIGMILKSFIIYNSDTLNIIRTLLVTPLIFASLSRLTTIYIKGDLNVYEAQTKMIDDFFETSERDLRFRRILMRHLRNLKFGIRFYFGALFILNHFPVLTAWTLSIYKNEYVYFVPIYLPIIDPETFSGFLINQCLMTWTSFTTYVTLSLVDFGTFIIFVMTISMTDIYKLKLEDIGIQLESYKKNEINLNEIYERVQIEKKLINLIKEFQLYSEYVKRLQKYIEVYAFIIILSNSLGIGLAIFSALTYSAPIGVSFIIGFVTQVAFVCAEGAIITHQKEKILMELWHFPWYDLSPKMKKIFLQFLHSYQNSPEIKLPVFGILNMEIFTNVISVSYSLFNFFIEFVKY